MTGHLPVPLRGQNRIDRRGRPPRSIDRGGRANRISVQTLLADEMAIRFEVGMRIRGLREEQGIAAVELGAAIGASIRTVLAWEAGRSMPRMIVLIAICRALSCSLRDLLGDVVDEIGARQ